MNSRGSVILPVMLALVGVFSMTIILRLIDKGRILLFQVSEYRDVDLTFTMQLIVFPMSFVALAIIYFYDKENFKTYFRFSLRSNSEWNLYGPLIAVAFTIGNAMMMSFAVMRDHGTMNDTFLSLLPWVVLFSATNAWFEEIFARFVVVAGLSGRLKGETICIISAIIFGVPHFFGTPSGFFGVIAAGTLGFFLAKLVVGTRSMGWALVIHFLQDMVIFGAGAMIIAGQHR